MTVQRKRWPWVLLFVSVVILIIALATSWNWVLVANYNKMILVARNRWALPSAGFDAPPWLSAILGTLGFSALVVLFALFFAKVLREMRLNQMQKDFLANMTHELKTPLASIELSASLLRKDLSEQDREELWQAHDIELKRLRDEIERLLTASRWEQFHDKPRLAPINLETWLDAALSRWQRMLPSGSVLIREGIELEGQAMLDIDLLKVITTNLIDNARKFAGERPPHITIHTSTSKSGSDESWAIRIEDKGLGFSPAEAPKIFKRFSRLKHRSDHAVPGTGLGLHLALSASQAMNLSLEASSDGPEKGARFVLKGKFMQKELES